MKIKGWGRLSKTLNSIALPPLEDGVAYSLIPPHSHRNRCGKEYTYGIL